jgi:hypothetical protein
MQNDIPPHPDRPQPEGPDLGELVSGRLARGRLHEVVQAMPWWDVAVGRVS